VGSDAHRADTFAWALTDGYAAAAAAGFEVLTFRRGEAPVASHLIQLGAQLEELAVFPRELFLQ